MGDRRGGVDERNEIATADGLGGCGRGGLVHQCGGFVFASRTALEAAIPKWRFCTSSSTRSASWLLRLYVEEKGMLSPEELADFTKKLHGEN